MYTQKQLIKAKETISQLELCNTSINSLSSISDLKLLHDENYDIYLSYICNVKGPDRSIEKFYLKIDKDGEQTIMNYTDFDSKDLDVMFTTLKPLTLEK